MKKSIILTKSILFLFLILFAEISTTTHALTFEISSEEKSDDFIRKDLSDLASKVWKLTKKYGLVVVLAYMYWQIVTISKHQRHQDKSNMDIFGKLAKISKRQNGILKRQTDMLKNMSYILKMDINFTKELNFVEKLSTQWAKNQEEFNKFIYDSLCNIWQELKKREIESYGLSSIFREYNPFLLIEAS